ncbi:MAG TPA: chorismate mutase [Gaiellaceae bacterium]|nr:chorismate mutase [Gaiellaceae bacterium]
MSTIETMRDEITALDVRILSTINARIRAVEELRRYKEEHGLSFYDPDREAWLSDYLKRVNNGPLSDEGVEQLLTLVLDLVKQEVQRG